MTDESIPRWAFWVVIAITGAGLIAQHIIVPLVRYFKNRRP